jgi:D-lactate dehydrogenase (cytochrome)
MSFCMSSSAKSLPNAQARFLASRRTSMTPLWMKNTTSKGRWNSSRAGNAGGKFEAGVGKGVWKGWTTFGVLGLMAATAFGAHGFAKYQAEGRELRMRDYSSPDKWVEPIYASRKDMEDVSLLRSWLRSRASFFFNPWGSFRDWGHLYRQHSRQPVGSGWDG